MKYIKHELPRDLKSLEVYPLSDLHVGDSGTDLQMFANFKKMILSQPNRYIILNGDLVNNAIKSSVSNCYAETMRPMEQKKWIIKELRELKDRILCITSGNHEARNKKDVDNDISYDIAAALGLEDLYDENGIILKVSLGERQGKDRQITYTFYVTHGFGGGKYVGSSLTNLENYGLTFEGVDIFIQGHVHKKAASKTSKIIVDVRNDTYYQRDVLHVISAAWQDYGAYAQKMMLRPGSKSVSPIILNGTRKDFGVIV